MRRRVRRSTSTAADLKTPPAAGAARRCGGWEVVCGAGAASCRGAQGWMAASVNKSDGGAAAGAVAAVAPLPAAAPAVRRSAACAIGPPTTQWALGQSNCSWQARNDPQPARSSRLTSSAAPAPPARLGPFLRHIRGVIGSEAGLGGAWARQNLTSTGGDGAGPPLTRLMASRGVHQCSLEVGSRLGAPGNAQAHPGRGEGGSGLLPAEHGRCGAAPARLNWLTGAPGTAPCPRNTSCNCRWLAIRVQPGIVGAKVEARGAPCLFHGCPEAVAWCVCGSPPQQQVRRPHAGPWEALGAAGARGGSQRRTWAPGPGSSGLEPGPGRSGPRVMGGAPPRRPAGPSASWALCTPGRHRWA